MQHNINPTLILGIAQKIAAASDARPGDLSSLEIRIYPTASADPAGYWFVREGQSLRWYYKTDPAADHFRQADSAQLAAALEAGARLQVIGHHGHSFGVWRSLAEIFACSGEPNIQPCPAQEA